MQLKIDLESQICKHSFNHAVKNMKKGGTFAAIFMTLHLVLSHL